MRLFSRPPDFIIGNPDQLRRWWVIPRNPFFNVYLLHIIRSDDDRALHDHPWWNMSIVLLGGYWEVLPLFWRDRHPWGVKRRWRGLGDVVLRWPTASHRLEIDLEMGDCWTLFITGPRFRVWGFHCPQGWIPWIQFSDGASPGQAGRGCGE